MITTRLVRAIERFNAQNNQGYDLSISAGVAYYDPEHPCTIDELLDRADKLMYEQKRKKKV